MPQSLGSLGREVLVEESSSSKVFRDTAVNARKAQTIEHVSSEDRSRTYIYPGISGTCHDPFPCSSNPLCSFNNNLQDVTGYPHVSPENRRRLRD